MYYFVYFFSLIIVLADIYRKELTSTMLTFISFALFLWTDIRLTHWIGVINPGRFTGPYVRRHIHLSQLCRKKILITLNKNPNFDLSLISLSTFHNNFVVIFN